ncbi:MAG: sulfatase [Blastocatellia bacterium]
MFQSKGNIGPDLYKRAIVCLIALILFAITIPTQAVGLLPNPNVLLIFADDLRPVLGAYGDPIARTPNIDRLARDGTRFTRAYCQFPLCNPSRTSFLSGKRPATTRVIDNSTNPRTRMTGLAFMPEYFRAQGYYAARIGKVEHNAWPNVVSWNLAENGISLTEEVTNQTRNMAGWKASDLAEEQLPEGFAARRALEMLRQSADRTFFIGVGFRRPHRPLVAPKKYFDLYNLDEIPLPAAALARDEVPLDQKREVIRAYYACVSFIDAQIGLLLDELEKLGLRQKTLILLVSDHGVDLGERNRFVRKQSLHENVVKVPLILSGPGVPCGLSLSQLVELVDVYPTMAELCKLPPPQGMEGLSFVPLLQNPAMAWKTAAFTDNEAGENPSRSIRTDQYRYTSFQDGKESLFDFSASPDETVDLATSSDNGDLLKEMKKLLKQGWQAALPSH